MGQEPIVRMNQICKRFPGVTALDHVSIDFYRGRVHVLVGENGAGKSTLIKVLAGIYQPEEGSLMLDGRKVSFQTPNEAQKAGISVIHQEMNVLPDMTVAENICLCREPVKKKFFINTQKMNRIVESYLKDIGANFHAEDHVRDLSTAQMQVMEIVRAVSQEAGIVVMDEPTACLSEKETASLFHIISQLKEKGVCIIYISHRMKEIYEIGDTVTVLKDGQLIETMPMCSSNADMLIRLMVGREIKGNVRNHEKEEKEVVLEVKGLGKKGCFHDISFQLFRSEILCISGLVGSGRTELLRCIFGADPYDEGEIYVKGIKAEFRRPQNAIEHGIGLVPEERRSQGIIIEQDVKENIYLTNLKKHRRGIFIDSKWAEKTAQKYISQMRIKTPSMDVFVKTLSGGNQQKIVIAKWLAADVEILLLDEPTRGIDVHAKSEIYDLLNDFTEKGGSILMVSSELPEVLNTSDRVIVIREGRLSGELRTQEATEEGIMRYASFSKEEIRRNGYENTREGGGQI